MRYQSTKTWGHELGLSCAFRQHRATSHCHYLHGYALSIRLVFESDELDAFNWVVDFGALKTFKQTLVDLFDHKLLVAEDDPMKDELCALAGLGLADVVIVTATGCERFAELVYQYANIWLQQNLYAHRVRVQSVEVKEHGANSAIYMG